MNEKHKEKSAIEIGVNLFLEDQMSADDFKKFSAFYETLTSNHNLDYVREYLYDFVQQMKNQISKAEIEGMFQEYIEQMNWLNNPLEKQVHDLGLQKSFAIKFWNYLMDNDRIGDFFVLFNYAYLLEITRLELSLETGEKTVWIKDLHQTMLKLLGADAVTAERLCLELWEYKVTYPPPDRGKTTLFVKMISAVNDEIVGLLLKFPYMKLARGEGNLFPFLN